MDKFNLKNICFTDFSNMYSPSYINKVLQGNWKYEGGDNFTANSRGYGIQNVYYKSDDIFNIEIHGKPDFKKRVMKILQDEVFPHVNLNFSFVDNNGDCIIDDKWAIGCSTFNGGDFNPVIKLSDATSYMVCHSFLHALGMNHEVLDPKKDLAWIISSIQIQYQSGNTNVYSDVKNPINLDNIVALSEDTPSIMFKDTVIGSYPTTNILSDSDKLWLQMTYGKKLFK